MEAIAVGTRYSADVKLWLSTAGLCYRLAKAGPERVMLVEASDVPPGPAEIVVIVDGRVHKTRVNVPHAGVPYDEFVEIESYEQNQPPRRATLDSR